ncbi:hypothetical protein LTR81_026052 [Elasticomyces elasticus]
MNVIEDITTELGKLAKKKTRQGRKTKNLLEQLPAIGESLLEDVYANICAPLRVLHDRDEDVALAAALNSEDARDATSYTSMLADLNALDTLGGDDNAAKGRDADPERNVQMALKDTKGG